MSIIGASAFANCSLTSVAIPAGVSSIGEGAFSGCPELTSVTINSNGVASKSFLKIIPQTYDPRPRASFGSLAEIFGSQVEEYVFGEGVNEIGESACYGLTNLTSVTIPKSVTSIGGGAFEGCSNLASVYITDLTAWCGISFNDISFDEDCVYNGYSYLTGNYYFDGTNPLFYSKRLFLNGVEVKDLVIPEGLTRISDHAFAGYKGLTSITIPESVTSIGDRAFEGCSNLITVNITDLTAWCSINFDKDKYNYDYNGTTNPLFYSKHLFLNGVEVKDLVIPEGLTRISDHAFAGYKGLNSILIPENLNEIGGGAFERCDNLTSITVKWKELEFIPWFDPLDPWSDPFDNNVRANATLFIPLGTLSAYEQAYGWMDFKEIIEKGVVLNYEGYTLNNIGTNVQLTATIQPENATNKNVTWTSSDESVCTVVNGLVTATGEGTAIVTVTTEDGEFTATCTISVEIPHPVTGISLDKEAYTLHAIDETVQLTTTIQPDNATNKNVTWSSSDESVCMVVDGLVTATGEGTAIITAKTEDGDFTATCVISVEIPHPVTGISLDKEGYTLHAIDETVQLTATIQPDNATNKNVTWSSSDEGVCTVVDGLVTAKGEGTAIVTVITEDGGFTATCAISVEIPHPVTGISLNYDNYSLKGIGESVQLEATILPENATNKDVTWKSYNENVCIVNKGLVVGVGYGVAVVSVTTADGSYMATCTITVEDNTPVNNIDANNQGFRIFNLQGVGQSQIQKGINIIRFNDGTTKKILVK